MYRKPAAIEMHYVPWQLLFAHSDDVLVTIASILANLLELGIILEFVSIELPVQDACVRVMYTMSLSKAPLARLLDRAVVTYLASQAHQCRRAD